MDTSEMRRVKEMEEENRHLKRMYSNLTMELDIAREIIEKIDKVIGSKEVEVFKTDYQEEVSLPPKEE